MNGPDIPERVLQFIAERIDTVPQLETLLLLAEHATKAWTPEEIAARVYVPRETAISILRSLHQRQLAATDGQSGLFRYSPEWDTSGTLMTELVTVYRRHLVQVTTFIHSGPSASVREFARAFDLKKGR